MTLLMSPSQQYDEYMLRKWDRGHRLSRRELLEWVCRFAGEGNPHPLRYHEEHWHICVPLNSDKLTPLILIAREIHHDGYKHRYFHDADDLPHDEAGRRTLSPDTDSTQQPGTRGNAWMCYSKDNLRDIEDSLYGLMYEIYARDPYYPWNPRESISGWRTLPVGKLFLPTSGSSPLSPKGLATLDELERSGALLTELSGLSVRPSAPHQGLIFHEIMRRMVHDAVAKWVENGLAKVYVFAIVENTRNSIQVRMGADNFIPLGGSFPPPGEGVDTETLLAPSIIELNQFLPRMVSSYRKAQIAAKETGRQPKVLIQGIRFYTQGMPWKYISRYPEMIVLLRELDEVFPMKSPRTAEAGWHDGCETNAACEVCYPRPTMLGAIAKASFW